ncbi:hypothetical protein ACU4GH_31430 [Bradyrhizobium betae]
MVATLSLSTIISRASSASDRLATLATDGECRYHRARAARIQGKLLVEPAVAARHLL